ncbi:hypothetical protein [Geosporobacter ferrireducens]|nr:hypothetical protein [Geosporobacter ferrireducens]
MSIFVYILIFTLVMFVGWFIGVLNDIQEKVTRIEVLLSIYGEKLQDK